MKLLVNIDVDDLEKATRFYGDGIGLSVGRGYDEIAVTSPRPARA